MKHENLFKIYIPEPCHEDWGKMTPNEQGAFCKVCSKTVVDFSVKTQDEIQKFLGENLEKKICGRFNSAQLDETPRLKMQPKKFEFPAFLFPLSFSPVRTYTMAVLLFASVALMSCGNSDTGGTSGGREDSTFVMVNGGLTIKPQNIETKEVNNTKADSSIRCVNSNMVGEVNIKAPIDSVKTDTLQVMGKMVPIEKNDTTNVKNQKTMGIMKKVTPEKDYLKGDVKFEN